MPDNHRSVLRAVTSVVAGTLAVGGLMVGSAAAAGPLDEALVPVESARFEPSVAAAGGTIAGTIQPASSNASVVVWRASDRQYAGVDTIDPTTGAYEIPGIAPGTYRVAIWGGAYGEEVPAGYTQEWYDDADSFEEATDVLVIEGGTATVDATLEPAALAKGSIYNVSVGGKETLVTAPDAAVSYFPVGSTPGANDARQAYTYGGNYELPLPAGTYKVAFGSLATGFGNAGFTTKQYYDKVTTVGDATSVSVAPTEVRTGVNAYYREAVTRLAGSDRFATSAAISADQFEPGVPVAYVANGLNFPDALSASAVAGINGGPILLVTPTSIPASIAAELERLDPARIVVLGGSATVSESVKTALDAYTTGAVTRLAGSERFATSAAISADQFEPGVPVAYVANGLNFPDALSASAVAGINGGPILLVTPTSIPASIAAELERLDPARIVVLGGSATVSESVKTALDAYTTGAVTRLAGSDRFATSAAISADQFEPGVPVAYVANGLNFPDALSASAVAGINGGPILLVTPTSIPASIAAELERLDPAQVVVVGGTGTVSDGVAQQLASFVAD